MAGGLSPTTPIAPRALKVEGGRIVHVIFATDEGGVGGHKSLGDIGSLRAPDGTYLRLDYVTDVIQGYADQLKAPGKPSETAQALASLQQFFEMRPL